MFKLNNSAGLCVKFSPLNQNLVALGSGDNFGIIGRGNTTILEYQENQQFKVVYQQAQPNAVFDICFSETVPHLCYSALGNGHLALDDFSLQSKQLIQIHDKEINTIHINNKLTNLILSSSNDRTAKIIDLTRLGQNNIILDQFHQHQGNVTEAVWHPISCNLFATVSQDSFIRIFDINDAKKNIVSIKGHDGEILCCDFNKYQEQIVTAGVDKTIKLWDLRSLKAPLTIMYGHRYPIKKVKCSPHHQNIVMSGSYDMNVNVFDTMDFKDPIKFQHKNHTEFVISIDFNLFNINQVASTGYDGTLRLWNWDQQQP